MSFRTIVLVTVATLALFMAAVHAAALACHEQGKCGVPGAPGQGHPSGPKSEEWWKSGSAPGALKPGSWSSGWEGKPQWPQWSQPDSGASQGKQGCSKQGKQGGKSCGHGGKGGR